MAFTDQYALGKDATFIQRVTVAVLKAAAAVQAENVDTANHERRSKLAEAAFFSSKRYGEVFAQTIAADPATAGITAASSDSDILFTTNSLWNAVAGQDFTA